MKQHFIDDYENIEMIKKCKSYQKVYFLIYIHKTVKESESIEMQILQCYYVKRIRSCQKVHFLIQV